MVLLLGATSYSGQAFAKALRRRKDAFIPLSRSTFDYSRFEFLFDYIRKIHPDFLINSDDTAEAAGQELAEAERMEMLQANTVLPQTIARVCDATNTPWGHLSSGSIYCGAKIGLNGQFRIEEDLSLESVRSLFAAHPERFRGFSELDEPNFSFKSSCTFYSGTKALAEEALRSSRNYIWRLRRPFNEVDEPANFLSQLQDSSYHHDAINSLSQLDECVSACLDLWDRRAPFGIYNVVNPGAISTHDLLQMIHRVLKPRRELQLLVYDGNGQTQNPKAPHSDCILDDSKLQRNGITLSTVHEAVERSLQKWQPNASRVLRTLA
jgi:dTDP-4-dehydrorhamnose reductase